MYFVVELTIAFNNFGYFNKKSLQNYYSKDTGIEIGQTTSRKMFIKTAISKLKKRDSSVFNETYSHPNVNENATLGGCEVTRVQSFKRALRLHVSININTHNNFYSYNNVSSIGLSCQTSYL